jgi:hypothetical protein
MNRQQKNCMTAQIMLTMLNRQRTCEGLRQQSYPIHIKEIFAGRIERHQKKNATATTY